MAVYKLGDGRWRVQVEFGRDYRGRRDRRSDICATEREALKLEARLKAEAERLHGKSDRATFGDFVRDLWWPEKLDSLAQTSLDSYEQDLRLRLMPAFDRTQLADIDRFGVQRMLNGCSSAKTAKRARDLLRAILNEAIDAQIISSNVATGKYRMPRAVATRPAEEETWLETFAEHMAVLDAARGAGEVEKLLLLGLCFGLRKGEILGLKWSDLDFDARTLTVMRGRVKSSAGNVEKVTKTESSVRTIPMPAYAHDRLLQLRDGRKVLDIGDTVCVSSRGGYLPPSTAEKQLRRWVTANNQPPLTIAALRHSFATACINSGVPINKVSEWLGHTNVTTTLNKYVKSRHQDLASEVGTIDDAMGYGPAKRSKTERKSS